MIRFLDGPAAGQVLQLRRAPRFLRVVQTSKGWDALDQLDDAPEPGELVHVYALIGRTGSVHLDGRNAKTGKRWSGTYITGDYRHFDQQPDDATARNNALWQHWAHARYLEIGKALEEME